MTASTLEKAPERRVILSTDGITKDFPGLRALDRVSIEIRSGEIVALLGQNGSGKSTLVKVLAGVYTADAGTVRVHADATDAVGGTGDALHFIHQDLGLIDSMSTIENLAIGRPSRALAPFRRRAEDAHAREVINRFGTDFDLRAPIAALTAAQRTIVAIARAMDGWSGGENVLVLDEPTASLHGEEVRTLFTAVRQVALAGAGVIYISHRLEEVTELAERVLVLRDGRLVADVEAAGLNSSRLAALITGRPAAAASVAGQAPERAAGESGLVVRDLSGGSLGRLDLEVARGEVVGVTGSLGSGREHVAGLIFGATRRRAGTVAVGGVALERGTPRESVRHGLALVPADRRAHGAVMTHSVRENITLPDLRPVSRAGIQLSPKLERADAHTWANRVGMTPDMPERALGLFSGGNQQKAVVARWLRTEPTVLVVEEPTQGVDVGSSEAIRALIVDAAATGTAVLVASSDNADLVRMCNRVIVLRDGECVAELRGAEITDHRLTQECLGAAPGESPNAMTMEASDV